MNATVSVIGPEQHRVETIAQQLRALEPEWTILAGAGPDAHPTAVVAVADSWDESSHRVITAVASGQGHVIVLAPNTTNVPELPGLTLVTTATDIPVAIRNLGIDTPHWSRDAYRADAERADRVRIAIRLAANRTITRLCGDGITNQQHWQLAVTHFLADLRTETLRHGVAFPTIDATAPPWPTIHANTPTTDIAIAIGATLGVIAAGVGVGRALGYPVAGALLGVIMAAIVAGIRVHMLRRGHQQRAGNQRAAQMQQHLGTLAADITTRLNIPRVAPTLHK